MDTPTPVTVVQLDEIDVSSPTTVVEGLAELPQFLAQTLRRIQAVFSTPQAQGV
jgi:hypothetical protein